MRPARSIFVLFIFTFCFGMIAETPENKSATTLPGSAWNATGNLSPMERGNTMSASYLEQGVTLYRTGSFSFVPYASLAASLDTKGYEWNNRAVGTLGMKFVKDFKSGTVFLACGYADEHRKGGTHKDAAVIQAVYWFGWQQGSQFQGSSWGTFGNTSPFERNNFIATSYVQQGVALYKLHSVSVIPFVECTLSRDSKGYDWNNRAIYGGGVKLLLPHQSHSYELGTAYQHEERFKSHASANAVTLFAKFWFGWR